jgi:Cu(I)/Ag(I) efflux system membrane protein CusA/SilA
MRRIAAPMLGGLFTSFLMELLIYPVIFYVAKGFLMRHEARLPDSTARGFSPVPAAAQAHENGNGEGSHV